MKGLFITCIDHVYHSETPGVIHKQRRMLFCCDHVYQVEAVTGNLRAMRQFSNIRVLEESIQVDRESVMLEVVTPETDRYYFEKDFIKNNLRRAG